MYNNTFIKGWYILFVVYVVLAIVFSVLYADEKKKCDENKSCTHKNTYMGCMIAFWLLTVILGTVLLIRFKRESYAISNTEITRRALGSSEIGLP